MHRALGKTQRKQSKTWVPNSHLFVGQGGVGEGDRNTQRKSRHYNKTNVNSRDLSLRQRTVLYTEPTEPGSFSDWPFSLGFLAFSYQDQHRSEDRCLLLPRLPVDSQVGLLPVVRETRGI